jgi:hypothetical protein
MVLSRIGWRRLAMSRMPTDAVACLVARRMSTRVEDSMTATFLTKQYTKSSSALEGIISLF